jgi:hypothetical protein
MTEDLKSFTIQSRVNQRVDRPASTPSGDAENAASVGFPRIEALVEADSLDLQGLSSRRAQLQEIVKSGGPKEKPAAQKAALAYERTEALLHHLMEIKASMGQGD